MLTDSKLKELIKNAVECNTCENTVINGWTKLLGWGNTNTGLLFVGLNCKIRS
jgi:hypothetical protein